MKKWTFVLIILLSLFAGCGKDRTNSESGNVTQGSLGLNMNVPNFESNPTQRKGIIFIPHTAEIGAAIHYEQKIYLVDTNKSTTASLQLIRKLFRNDVDARPYEQNSAGTFYRARFIGKFNMDSIILQFLNVH